MFTPLGDPKEQLEQLGRSWKFALASGILTFVLGILVTADPGTSLVLLAVLIGLDFVFAGVFRLIRSLADKDAPDRALTAVMGILFLVIGLFLIRHLGVTLLLISTLVGVLWIVLGVAEIGAGIAMRPNGGLWPFILGGLSFVAGIVVLASPVGSLLTLALLVGIWLMIRGVAQIMAALSLRKATKPS